MSPQPPSDDDWIFDPMLSALDRQLRRELREEAAEIESVVAESELREQYFSDIARELRNRADFVGVAMTQRTFNGYVLYAKGDLLTMRTQSFEVDINITDIAYLRVLRPGSARGGRPNDDGPGTFEMRMVERRSPIERVELGFRNQGDTVTGLITSVGQDHLQLTDDNQQDWVIPLPSIAYAIQKGRRSYR
jgi:hypothetical protein